MDDHYTQTIRTWKNLVSIAYAAVFVLVVFLVWIFFQEYVLRPLGFLDVHVSEIEEGQYCTKITEFRYRC